MTMNKNLAAHFAAVLIAVVSADTLHAAYNVIDTPAVITMDGPTLFTASGQDVTNVWTGKITGTGPAIIEGGGTVAFANSANDYTGGTLVSNAVFRLDADGCAGTGAITGAINTAHVFINCENVPNDLRFLSSPYNTSYMKPGAYPASQQNLLFPLQSSVTIEGEVSFAHYGMLYDSTSPAMVSPLPTVTYKKGVSVEEAYLYLCPLGRMIFEGPYKGSAPTYANSVALGYKYNAYGAMEFHASSNVAYRVSLYDADLDFRAVDAFPETLFYYENCGNDYCKMLLNGNDQTILGVCMKSSLTPGETAKGMCITSDAPATVRIIGCKMNRVAGSLVNRLALFGNVSLVMDVDSAYTSAGFFQDFSVRKSTTTGDLIISNGDFRVSGTASFPNVPNIYVGENGSFTNASTKSGAFAGCKELTVLGSMACTGDATPFGYKTMNMTLGPQASFSIPAGATVTVLSLKVGDTDMPDGTYGDGGIAVDQIKQGTVVVERIYADVSDTWTGGGGADTSIGTAENWNSGETPDLAHGSLLATFATGGAAADIDRDLSLRGIVLSKPDTGFSFMGAGRTLSLDAAGLAFSDATPAADGSPRTYLFEPQVRQLQLFDQTFAIPTNVTVNFAGGYLQTQSGSNLKTGDGTLVLGGNSATPGRWRFDGGSVELSGTNRIDGKIIVTNTVLTIRGAITQSGSGNNNIVLSAILADGKPRSKIILDNADIGKNVSFYGPGNDAGPGWFVVTPNSTNIFRDSATFTSPIGHLSLGPGSETTFAGSISLGGLTTLSLNGEGMATVVFRGKLPTLSGSGLRVGAGTVLRYVTTGQITAPGCYISGRGGTMRFEADNVLDLSGSGSPKFFLDGAGSVLDLTDTVQELRCLGLSDAGKYQGNATSVITGRYGSELRIRNGFVGERVTDGVSLTSCGTSASDVFTLTNTTAASCGDIKAESGTFDIAHNASWLNGTNVTVCGGATLKINNSATFGDHAVLRAEGGDWAMVIGNGVRQKFAEFYIGGQRQPSGTYGAVGNTAAKYRLSNFTGAGVIKVGKLGTSIILR